MNGRELSRPPTIEETTPRHRIASSLAILAAVLVTIAVLWRLGAARHGDPGAPPPAAVVLPFGVAVLTGTAMIGIDVATDLHKASEESLKLVTGALILVAILGALLDPELESRLEREP